MFIPPAANHSAALAILLAGFGSSGAAEEDSWKPVADSIPVLSAASIRECAGSTLIAGELQVVRERGGVRTALGCTASEGTGRIRDMALDPAGCVFVAAERGLFVVSPDVDVLAPVWKWDGAPLGSPRSVHVDALRRVWIATDREIGVIDPCFGWGRTLTDARAPPGGPPYRLADGSNGTLLVETAAGTFRYHADRGARPLVTNLVVGGEPWMHGETVRGRYGHALRISATGTAIGGASFRYRIDRHHVWRELGEEAIRDIPPGAHVVDVIAVDCDLRRSEPARIAVEFDLPRRYEKSFVMRIALLVCALVVAGFAWRAVRRGGGRAEWLRVPISSAIVIVLVVQVLAGLVPHAKGWPFIGFSMYTNTYEEGSTIYDERIVGIDRNGGVGELDFRGVVPFADDPWQVIRPLVDGGPEVSRAWIERYNSLHPDLAIIGLQSRADRRILTPHGAVRIAPLILSSYFVEELSGGR
jgi:hypothetical protein